MKTASLCCARLIGFLVLAVALASGQNHASPKYDSANEVKVKGAVESIKEVPNSCGKLSCLHLMLKTDKGLLEVQIAPLEFLKELEVAFTPGEPLEIVGANVKQGDTDLLLAREILRKGGDAVVTRDPKGDPVWTFMLSKQKN